MKNKLLASIFLMALAFTVNAQSGAIDLSFDPGTGANGSVDGIAIQSDGKIIIGGWFTSYNGTARNYIARLNADGTLDESFNIGTGANSGVDEIAIQSDGKIIIGGWFTSYNGTARNRIARLNADGTLDVTFDPGTGANSGVYAIAIQSDGKIIIGGQFTNYNGTNRNHIARLNDNGILDLTFDPGSGTNRDVDDIAIDGDEKIIIVGYFSSYNGTFSDCIARLNTNGSFDGTFNNISHADDAIEVVAIQSDGKILIGGYFRNFGGVPRKRIARLNTNGTLDETFEVGTGIDNLVTSIAIQSDGKIIIGGSFGNYNGTAINDVARLNTNGSLDETFDPGLGTDNTIWETVLQSDGKIIIVGQFTSYYGIGRNRVARILSQEKESAANGSWNLANTWNPVGVPVISDDIIIKHTVTVADAPLAVCNNMIINSGGVVQIDPGEALTVDGVLANNAGVAGLVLKSDATGTGSLIHNSFNINATVERYLTGNANTNGTYDYHLVSLPFDADGVSNIFLDMYLYDFDQTLQNYVSMGSSTNNPLDNNKGYMIFYPEASRTVIMTGELNNGAFTAVTATDAPDEFSLVPNPYPSAIDWDAGGGWTKTNLQDAFYIWDPSGNNYVTWAAGAGTALTSSIPVGQSFFVKSNAAAPPVLTMTNDVRVHSTQAFWKESDEMVSEVFKLQIKDSESMDAVIVRFNDQAGAERGFMDADKLNGAETAPQLYSLTNASDKLTINALPHSTSTVVVPLGLEYTLEGQLEFIASGIETFGSEASFFLEDKLSGEMIDLKATPTYSFTRSAGDDVQRFALHFRGVTAINEMLAKDYSIWGIKDHLNVYIPAHIGKKSTIELYDMLGHLVVKEQVVLDSPNILAVPQFNGMGLVKVICEGSVYSEKVFIQ